MNNLKKNNKLIIQLTILSVIIISSIIGLMLFLANKNKSIYYIEDSPHTFYDIEELCKKDNVECKYTDDDLLELYRYNNGNIEQGFKWQREADSNLKFEYSYNVAGTEHLHTTKYEYDENDNLKFKYEYNASDQLIRKTGYRITFKGSNLAKSEFEYNFDNTIKREYAYDNEGHLHWIFEYEYDEDGNLKFLHAYDGSGLGFDLETKYEYDTDGNIIDEINYTE